MRVESEVGSLRRDLIRKAELSNLSGHLSGSGEMVRDFTWESEMAYRRLHCGGRDYSRHHQGG